MLAGVTDCRRSWKWGCKGRWALGYNLATTAVEGEDHVVLKEKRGPGGFGGEEGGPCGFGVLLFAVWLRQQERLCREEKGGKGSCWWAMRRCHTALDYLEIAAATQLMVPGA